MGCWVIYLLDRTSKTCWSTCPHDLVAAKTPSWSFTSQHIERSHTKEHESKRKRCRVQPGGTYSAACMKFSVMSWAFECTQTNQALDRSPLFQRVKNSFQLLLAACVYSCIHLQDWPAQEYAARRDHLWMKYLSSSAAEVKSTSWVVWDTKFCVITGIVVPHLPVLFRNPHIHPSILPSVLPSLPPSLSPPLSPLFLHYLHWLVRQLFCNMLLPFCFVK